MNDPQRIKTKKRSYPEFWNKFIPVAVALITVVVVFLVYVTIRVALGLTAFN